MLQISQGRFSKLVEIATDANVAELNLAQLADEVAALKKDNAQLADELARHRSRADELEAALPTLQNPALESVETLKVILLRFTWFISVYFCLTHVFISV